MKGDNLKKFLGCVITFVFVIGLFCLYGGINRGLAIFWAISIPCLVIGASGFVTMLVFSIKADKKAKSGWKDYARLPKIKVEDFAAEIEKVRENFAEDTDPYKNRFPKPDFHGVKPYYDFSVLNYGKIYYGILVQANKIIFKRSRLGYDQLTAGVVAYSTDEYFDKNPYELNAIAEIMYANKRHNSLRNESRYFSNIKLKGELTEDRNIYMTTLLLYRNHLPFGYMAGQLFPVIAAPNDCTSVFAVDCKYWTDALVSNFMYGDANYKQEELFGEFDGHGFPDEE